MTATINANLAYNPRDPHTDEPQVRIPLRLPPSFSCTVVLGECTCPARIPAAAGRIVPCRDYCPARHVRVSASIISPDGTWEKSEPSAEEVFTYDVDQRARDAYPAEVAAVRDRWALVKALVLGHTDLSSLLTGPTAAAVLSQRDTVFSALADMARLEDSLFAAQVRLDKAAKVPGFSDLAGVSSDTAERPSAEFFAAYVTHLIEQVGVLGVSS